MSLTSTKVGEVFFLLHSEYKRFKGFIKKILRRINFEIDFKAINPIMEENEEALKELFFYFIDKEDPKISEKTEGTSKVKT